MITWESADRRHSSLWFSKSPQRWRKPSYAFQERSPLTPWWTRWRFTLTEVRRDQLPSSIIISIQSGRSRWFYETALKSLLNYRLQAINWISRLNVDHTINETFQALIPGNLFANHGNDYVVFLCSWYLEPWVHIHLQFLQPHASCKKMINRCQNDHLLLQKLLLPEVIDLLIRSTSILDYTFQYTWSSY